MSLSFLFASFVFTFLLWFRFAPQWGSKPDSKTLQRIHGSPNFKNKKFINLEPTPIRNPESPLWKTLIEFMHGSKNRSPSKTIDALSFKKENFLSESGFFATWFGHSTVLININGFLILADPVFSNRPSPVSFLGTKNFQYSHRPSVMELPEIDIMLISHDHYDHLDYASILKLKKKVKKFLVPLGVISLSCPLGD